MSNAEAWLVGRHRFARRHHRRSRGTHPGIRPAARPSPSRWSHAHRPRWPPPLRRRRIPLARLLAGIPDVRGLASSAPRPTFARPRPGTRRRCAAPQTSSPPCRPPPQPTAPCPNPPSLRNARGSRHDCADLRPKPRAKPSSPRRIQSPPPRRSASRRCATPRPAVHRAVFGPPDRRAESRNPRPPRRHPESTVAAQRPDPSFTAPHSALPATAPCPEPAVAAQRQTLPGPCADLRPPNPPAAHVPEPLIARSHMRGGAAPPDLLATTAPPRSPPPNPLRRARNPSSPRRIQSPPSRRSVQTCHSLRRVPTPHPETPTATFAPAPPAAWPAGIFLASVAVLLWPRARRPGLAKARRCSPASRPARCNCSTCNRLHLDTTWPPKLIGLWLAVFALGHGGLRPYPAKRPAKTTFLVGLPVLGVLSMPASWLLLERAGWSLVPQVQPLRLLLLCSPLDADSRPPPRASMPSAGSRVLKRSRSCRPICCPLEPVAGRASGPASASSWHWPPPRSSPRRYARPIALGPHFSPSPHVGTW